MRKLNSRNIFTMIALLVLAVILASATTRSVLAAGPTVGTPHIYHTPQWYKTNGATRFTPTDNLVYGGGPVMHSLTAYAVFWEPHNNMAASYISLIQRYFTDINQSNLYNIVSQYYSNPGPTYITNSSVYGGSWIDTVNSYPHAGTAADPIFDSDIRAEVTRAVNANNWPVGLTNMIFVFTEYGIESCDGTGSCTPNADPNGGGYCAYHNFFTDGQNNTVVYANMPFASTWGCTTASTFPNDLNADIEISVISHEQFEAVTDPEPTYATLAWYDQKCGGGGLCGEIGDKCAYRYGTQAGDGSNVTLNSNAYLVQQEWSNAALNDTAYSACQLAYTAPPPGTVTVNSVWTGKSKKKVTLLFKPGKPIFYFAQLLSTNSAKCTTTAHYVATDGIATILDWTGPINVPAGKSNWYIKTKIPKAAPLDTYTFTVSTTDCNGNTSSNSSQFTLTPTGRAPVGIEPDAPVAPEFEIQAGLQ